LELINLSDWILLKNRLFDNFAGFDALGADFYSPRFTIDTGVNCLQIRFPASQGKVMSVADRVADTGFLTAYIANLRH
jgi:hypothetical protein